SRSKRHLTGLEGQGEIGVVALLEGLEAEEPSEEEDDAGARPAGERSRATPPRIADDAADEDQEPVRDRETEIVHLA
ncbi:hypothetical protein MUK42_21904, partial [Musa troglodytarum]